MTACAGSLPELEESSCTAASGAGPGAEEGSGALATLEEHLLTGHSGAVGCLAMYQDHLLFSGSTDCTIKVSTPFETAGSAISCSRDNCMRHRPVLLLYVLHHVHAY